jgi:hypothetical protein
MLTKIGRIRNALGWSGKRVVMTFTRSVTDMECGCICESESELLECGDSGGEVGADYE